MARKRKRHRQDEPKAEPESEREGEAPPSMPAAPVRLARPFEEALRGVKVAPQPKPDKAPAHPARGAARPAPTAARAPAAPHPDSSPAAPSYEDRVALSQALAGVRPLTDARGRSARRVTGTENIAPPKPVARASAPSAADAVARARLASLVAGGLSFDVRHDDVGRVEGTRKDAPSRARDELREGRATPEAEIDLHGLSGDDADARLVRFVQSAVREGRRIVRIVHGKGLHSEGGLGVLGDRVIRTLTTGAAAPAVLAFVSAAPAGGGTGALVVRLVDR